MNNKHKVLITGASNGIGRTAAEVLVKKGFEVTGTSRNPDDLKEDKKVDGVIYKPLDLQKENSIDNLLDGLDRVDVLVNNAGASQIGPIEEISIEKIRNLFELNFFGHVHLIQGILPKMRKQGYGTIINITSISGRIPVPFTCTYSASKAAMEKFSVGLRSEVKKFGINIVTLIPSYIKTGILQEKILLSNSVYLPDLNNVKRQRDMNIEKGSDPEVVAETIVHILKRKNPAPCYIVGKYAGFISFLNRILPDRVTRMAVRRKFKMNV